MVYPGQMPPARLAVVLAAALALSTCSNQFAGTQSSAGPTPRASAQRDSAPGDSAQEGVTQLPGLQPTPLPQPRPSAPPLTTASDGFWTVNVPVGKIEVDTTVDHVSTLIVEPNRIFWRHSLLGVPTATQIRLYDTAGKLINDQPWSPAFALGKGANCAPALYCRTPCECDSDEIKLTVPTQLKGQVLKTAGRGGVDGGAVAPGVVHVLVRDCGTDCGRAGDKLSGTAPYSFVVR